MIPSAFGRVLIGHDPAYSYFNNLGGTEFGRYNTQQMPFVGINHVEVFENAVIVGKLEFRQRMGRKHYLSVIGNYALQDDNFFDLFGRKGIWGGGIGYSRFRAGKGVHACGVLFPTVKSTVGGKCI